MAWCCNASPVVRTRSCTPMGQELSKLIPPISADHTIGNHMNKTHLGHAKSYYNTARGSLYSRYTTCDWDFSNKSNYDVAEREKSLGERIRSDAWRAVQSTDQRTRNRQQANTKKLKDRMTHVAMMKDDLLKEIRAMDDETKLLNDFKRCLEKALSDTRGPLQIAEECLMQREKRIGIDQVHDDVERNLSKEVALIKHIQEKMKKLIEKAAVQLKLNRAVQHDCERDAKDKHHAQDIDDRMHMLRNNSGNIGYHPGIECVDNTITVPYTWMKFTQENITRSQKEREMSEKLRGEIDNCLRQWANQMWSQFNTVNNAFMTRVQELQDAKTKLQAHLHRTINEIRDMERSLGLLRQAIDDKEAYLKVAQTRLQERTNRINVELCKDPSMKGLWAEVCELRETVRHLKERLCQGENAVVRLNKTRATLENEIAVKENSLMIDSNYCLGMRKNMPMDPKMAVSCLPNC